LHAESQYDVSLANIKIQISLLQVNAAAEVIYDLVDPNANLIFGAVVDESYSGQVQTMGKN
jgi:cell division GTPase FtsZ